MNLARDRRGPGVLFYTGAFLLAALWLVPVLFLVMTAIRSQGDLVAGGVFSLPRVLRFSNFTTAWKTAGMGELFTSSFFLTMVKVPLGLAVSSLAAYAMAKTRLPGRRSLLLLFLLGLGVPIQVTLMPLVMMMRGFGMTDSPLALVPPYIALGLPLQILVLHGFFRAIPQSLIEAARMDGCSELGTFFRVVLPLAKPALATLFIIDAVGTWNEFLLALVLLTSETWRTVPLGMLHFQGQFAVRYAELSAAVLLSIAPVVIVYLIFQRYMVSGITSGAVKG
jgi:raffinose/stachyose/melibiose transport system permease protein